MLVISCLESAHTHKMKNRVIDRTDIKNYIGNLLTESEHETDTDMLQGLVSYYKYNQGKGEHIQQFFEHFSEELLEPLGYFESQGIGEYRIMKAATDYFTSNPKAKKYDLVKECDAIVEKELLGVLNGMVNS